MPRSGQSDVILCFKQDGLHMNQNGYDLWTAILKPKILESIR